MKPIKLPTNKLVLLVTSMLFSPSLALAQEPSATEPAGGAMVADDGELVVLGRFIPQPMRETSEVVSVLSAADLARTGDDTVAAALTRVAGLSVSNRYVYVRGLGDRYSSALLNGSPLPSPEPLRRQVPLDLFPSNILEGATVQKTYSPSYPGEFGGGIIDLQTLRIPNAPFFSLKGGIGANTATFTKKGLTYYGESANREWTTYSGQLRDVPNVLQDAIDRGVRIQRAIGGDPGFTPAELETVGESLVNSPFTVVQSEKNNNPNAEGEVTGGTSFEIGQATIGIVGVGGYNSSWNTRAADRVTVVGNIANKDFDYLTSTWDVVGNALGGVSAVIGEHEVSLTGLLIRNSTKYTQNGSGFDLNFSGGDVYKEGTAWYERQLGSVQLSGKHEFGPLAIDWRGAFARSTRDAPYERSITYVVPSGGGAPSYAPSNGGNETRFSYLVDEVGSVGVDASYTLPLSETRDVVFSFGAASSNTIRDYEFYSFSFSTAPTTPAAELRQRPDYLFSPDNIRPDRFEIVENLNPNANYKGAITVDGAYFSADAELLPLLRAAAGVRYETAEQTVRTFVRYQLPAGFTQAPNVLINEDYWLPAVTLTWNFAEDLQMRLGYSQTVARPQFRELAFTPYIDPDTDRTYQGNPYLTDSEFKNYDARLEYYFGQNRYISAGAFYKQIDKPIEEVVISPNGTDILTRFLNAPEATLYGAEMDFRTTFSTPFDAAFLQDFEWLVGLNYTYTHSDVSAEGDVVNIAVDPRPTGQAAPTAPATRFISDGSELQGTPKHIANAQFGFQTSTTELTMLVGYVSERIGRRGSPGVGNVPTVYEDPGVNLDLVFRRTFDVGAAEVTFGASGRNLLDEQHMEYQESALGRTDFNTYDRGRSFSISLTAKY